MCRGRIVDWWKSGMFVWWKGVRFLSYADVSKRLEHGSQAVMTRYIVWGWFVLGSGGSIQKTGSRLAGRDDAVI